MLASKSQHFSEGCFFVLFCLTTGKFFQPGKSFTKWGSKGTPTKVFTDFPTES